MELQTSWYWTADRLSVLVEVLNGLTFWDDKGCYFPPLDLTKTVTHAYAQRGTQLCELVIMHGLVILTQLGILGKRCSCKESTSAHCRRRFHPSWKVPLLDVDIDALDTRFLVGVYR
jgi:hypothetical protein